MPASDLDPQLSFSSAAADSDDLRLLGARGREALSTLFEIDLLLSSISGPLSEEAAKKLLGTPCTIVIGRSDPEVVHGLLDRLELLDLRGKDARYLARLVPNLTLLQLTQASRVFQDVTVPTMIQNVLSGFGMKSGVDFEVIAGVGYAEREYVVQYEESDWTFLERWMEHEGLYYWFEHGTEAEKLVVADNNALATPIDPPRSIRYRERHNLRADEATIWDLRVRDVRVPARVSLSDYNHRTPHIALRAAATVDERYGFGTKRVVGEHFKTNEEGQRLAELRAEHYRCKRRTFLGESDCERLRVGHTFRLRDCEAVELDGDYLVTALEFDAGLPVDELGEGRHRRYFARFSAIPLAVQFRPEARTPWPVVEGLVNAHVEADSDGKIANIDDHGRYKVRLPFDASGVLGSKASRWVRMAQASSGGGFGMHFPLHKGTEVLLGHVHGDPDRPVIVASVPNAHTPSPSNKNNPTQSVIETASGIRVVMEDGE